MKEISVQSRELTLERTWPPFPVQRQPGTVTHHVLEVDSVGSVTAAFSTEAEPPNASPVRAQVFVLDTAGRVTTVLDEPGAVVRSLAVTPTRIVTVLRRSDGSSDVVVRPRRR
jgi:hypothetical protein